VDGCERPDDVHVVRGRLQWVREEAVWVSENIVGMSATTTSASEPGGVGCQGLGDVGCQGLGGVSVKPGWHWEPEPGRRGRRSLGVVDVEPGVVGIEARVS
jgi:hypothetical protein